MIKLAAKKNDIEYIIQVSPTFHVPQEIMYSRAAQCIDKEILISKNGNIDIDIEIDKRMF